MLDALWSYAMSGDGQWVDENVPRWMKGKGKGLGHGGYGMLPRSHSHP